MSKKHIATISPSKPVSQMTPQEIHALVEEITRVVSPKLKASIEQNEKSTERMPLEVADGSVTRPIVADDRASNVRRE